MTHKGDSGGSLVVRGWKDGVSSFKLYGILACGKCWRGSECSSIYTRVDYYRSWVEDHIKRCTNPIGEKGLTTPLAPDDCDEGFTLDG